MASANGRERIVLRVTPRLRKRFLAAKEQQAERLGGPVSTVSIQSLGLTLLGEAMDARGIPRFEEEPDDVLEDEPEQPSPAADDPLERR
jgi:hypothetical protein